MHNRHHWVLVFFHVLRLAATSHNALVGRGVFSQTGCSERFVKWLNIIVHWLLKSAELPAHRWWQAAWGGEFTLWKFKFYVFKLLCFFFIYTFVQKREKQALMDTQSAAAGYWISLFQPWFQKAVLIVFTQHKELKEIDSVFTKATHLSQHLHGVR